MGTSAKRLVYTLFILMPFPKEALKRSCLESFKIIDNCLKQMAIFVSIEADGRQPDVVQKKGQQNHLNIELIIVYEELEMPCSMDYIFLFTTKFVFEAYQQNKSICSRYASNGDWVLRRVRSCILKRAPGNPLCHVKQCKETIQALRNECIAGTKFIDTLFRGFTDFSAVRNVFQQYLRVAIVAIRHHDETLGEGRFCLFYLFIMDH